MYWGIVENIRIYGECHQSTYICSNKTKKIFFRGNERCDEVNINKWGEDVWV
jgi:hypothetical protein